MNITDMYLSSVPLHEYNVLDTSGTSNKNNENVANSPPIAAKVSSVKKPVKHPAPPPTLTNKPGVNLSPDAPAAAAAPQPVPLPLPGKDAPPAGKSKYKYYLLYTTLVMFYLSWRNSKVLIT